VPITHSTVPLYPIRGGFLNGKLRHLVDFDGFVRGKLQNHCRGADFASWRNRGCPAVSTYAGKGIPHFAFWWQIMNKPFGPLCLS
jgi:hypothetical protein